MSFRKFTVHMHMYDKDYAVKEPNCFVCKHCCDMFWDYTHGPYMAMCECYDDSPDPEACGMYQPDEECPIVDINDERWHKVVRRNEETPEH